MFDAGRPLRSRHFTVLFARRETPPPEGAALAAPSAMNVSAARRSAEPLPGRLGLVVAKRHFRSAVVRHRIKRRIRERFRRYKGATGHGLLGVDLIVMPRRGAETLSPSSFSGELDGLLDRVDRTLAATVGGGHDGPEARIGD